jgi:cysteine desulfurase family protein (TIGR01976 family)
VVTDPVAADGPVREPVTVLDVRSVRARFPALARIGDDGRPPVLADAPGGSQVPDAVIDAVTGHYRRGMSNTHGAFATSQETDDVVADARRAAADLAGADPGEIVFGPNATTLLFHVSRSFSKTLEPGDEVVVTRLDHDANVRPWVLAATDAGASVRWVDVHENDVTIDIGSFEAALSPRTKLVAFTLASNAVGTIPPAAELVARAKEVGAVVAVDAVHLAQHRLPDLHGLGADLLACSPYKFFGPHLGMLAVRRSLLESWTPYKLVPAPDEAPARWETGTQNHEGLAGLIAAVEYLAGVAGAAGTGRRERLTASYETIAAYERTLAERSRSGSGTSIRHTRPNDSPNAASSYGTATTTPGRS